MDERELHIRELLARIDQLSRQQQHFQREIETLRGEVARLIPKPAEPPPVHTGTGSQVATQNRVAHYLHAAAQASSPGVSTSPKKDPTYAWESFVGENLLNKVGIAVLVLGISFGAKYSIDHALLTPLWRIVMGYLAGVLLIAIALKLKRGQTAFSAVLLSGGMAVLYFITYAAHSFYGMMPQAIAFFLMALLTMATVSSSLWYNVEVIGIIGLAGAYAVPLLLHDGSGRVTILFTYISIINAGILFLSFRKYWKTLYYIAFILTWLTFASWYAFSFDWRHDAWISMTFSTVVFITFYIAVLSYKLVRKELLGRWDVVLMLLNSFLYFGYGYLTVDAMSEGYHFLGLFAMMTALIHFTACAVVYKSGHAASDVFYFVAAMTLVFVTIAVPVQLEGNWVTLVWSAEAALLFWIGRARGFAVYEKLSYPLVALAFLSLLQDWNNYYPASYASADADETVPTFLNVGFLTSMFTGAALAFINAVGRRMKPSFPLARGSAQQRFIQIAVPLLTIATFYFGFYKEIRTFWIYQYANAHAQMHGGVSMRYDESIPHLSVVWLIIYSALFATVLSLLQSRLKTRTGGLGSLAFNTGVLLAFISGGIFSLAALRDGFLSGSAAYFHHGIGIILIGYLCVVAMVPLLWFNRKILRQGGFDDRLQIAENLFFHFVMLALLSSELIHWLEMARVENTFKLSLSILWGSYGLFLIALGLARDEKHLRIAAMVLFAITLLKLFAYDLAGMSTILKTVVMIALGILLLTASFIYNRYKSAAESESR
jgi:uncharacterized membrane protein